MSQKEHDETFQQLIAREPIFHRREFGISRTALEEMTAADFWEVGASGKVYDRETVIETLLDRYQHPEPHDWPCHNFKMKELGKDTYLLTYVLEEPGRRTRRMTIWRLSNMGWQILYHQGTLA